MIEALIKILCIWCILGFIAPMLTPDPETKKGAIIQLITFGPIMWACVGVSTLIDIFSRIKKWLNG
jgi:hypothetical protein